MNKAGVLFALIILSAAAAAEEYMGLEWNYTTAEILSGVDVGDVNGDGILEVGVSGSSDGRVYLLDSEGKQLWMRDVFSYINTVAMADVNGDGRDEVIGGHTDMSVFDGKGEGWKYKTANPVHEVGSGDVSGDGADDIVALGYDKSSCRKSGIVQAINGAKREELWQYSVGKDIPHSLAVADLDGDGTDEVLVGLIYRTSSSQGPCEKAYSHESAVLALKGGRLLWQYATSGAVISLAVGDVNGDGSLEVIAGSYPTLYVLDNEGGLVWKSDQAINSYVEDVAAADLDGDNRSEVIAGSDRVHVFKPDGTPLWTGLTDGRVYSVAAGDLNDDGRDEVIAGSASIYVFNGAGSQMWRSPSHTSYGFIEAADLDGRGYEEIIAGSIKNIYVYRTQDYARRMLADELYGRALILSGSNPGLAVENLEDAKDLYSQLGLMVKVSECVNQMNRLSNRTGREDDMLVEADSMLNMSKAFLGSGDYVNASVYASKAREKYSSLTNQRGIDECKDIINITGKVIAYNASQELLMANASYHAGDFEGSLGHARNAEAYYTLVGDAEHAGKARTLVSNLSAMLGLGEANKTGGDVPDVSAVADVLKAVKPIYVVVFFIVLVVAAILALVLYYIWSISRRRTLKVESLHRVRYDAVKADATPVSTLPARRREVVEYTATPHEEEAKVNLPPNRGVFKSSRCGAGLCLKMTRLRRRR